VAQLVILLTDDPRLRSWALQWRLGEFDLAVYEDMPAALAAARDAEVALFVWDARSHAGAVEGIMRRLRDLSSAPEILVLARGDAAELGLPRENVHQGEPREKVLAEQVERLLRLRRVRRDSGIVGQSPAVRELISTIAQVAPLDVPVLIQGESGTGKELVARALHAHSARVDAPFVSVNVGSLAESLLASELFGHEKGAFTGAVEQHQGVFERAKGGTLFLDEVGEMPPSMQVQLLRVLETGEFTRVGGRKTLVTDIRLITATHRKLEEEIRRGVFRSDLYYRLKVVKIDLPPLRERVEDILILAHHFLALANRKHRLDHKGFTREATEKMLRYLWPGNVRELRNVVQSMAVLGKGPYLGVEDLPPEVQGELETERPLPMAFPPEGRPGSGTSDPLLAHTLLGMAADLKEILRRLEALEERLGVKEGPGGIPWSREAPVAEVTPLGSEGGGELENAEKAMIQSCLRQNGGNRRRTAQQLGISERTLYRKLKRYGMR